MKVFKKFHPIQEYGNNTGVAHQAQPRSAQADPDVEFTGVFMRYFKSYLQHHFNPLHVYCRLRDYGLSYRAAIRISSAYERVYRVCSFKTTSRC